MAEVGEFADALLRAYMGAGPRLEVSVLAVTSVALERAAEAVDRDAAVWPLSGDSADYVEGFHSGVDCALRAIRALIPDEVEGLLPVEAALAKPGPGAVG